MSAITKALQQLPIDKYGDIRFAKERLSQRVLGIKLKTAGDRIWFLDAPEYGNLGDQAIAYALIKFCGDNFPERELIEFQENNVIQYLKWLKKNINPSDTIILQGGGNLGDLYPRYEYVRRTIIRNFPDNKIILFPQSLSFSSDDKGKKERAVFVRTYGKHKHLIVFARDSYSYKRISRLLPSTDVRLCPDIGFYLVGITEEKDRHGLGLCLRQDTEKSISDNDLQGIIGSISGTYSTHDTVSTLCDSDQIITGTLREQLVKAKLNEFSGHELIITDRLHGMIFSYVTSTPCVALNNVTGKSEHAYKDWLTGSDSILFLKAGPSLDKLPEATKSKKLDFTELKNALAG